MTLMSWREYRTKFHIAQSYGVSEATVCRIIRKVEDFLVRSKKSRLPGKKALQAADTVFEVVLVDVTATFSRMGWIDFRELVATLWLISRWNFISVIRIFKGGDVNRGRCAALGVGSVVDVESSAGVE